MFCHKRNLFSYAPIMYLATEEIYSRMCPIRTDHKWNLFSYVPSMYLATKNVLFWSVPSMYWPQKKSHSHRRNLFSGVPSMYWAKNKTYSRMCPTKNYSHMRPLCIWPQKQFILVCIQYVFGNRKKIYSRMCSVCIWPQKKSILVNAFYVSVPNVCTGCPNISATISPANKNYLRF